MGNENLTQRINIFQTAVKICMIIGILECVTCYNYPYMGGKYYHRNAPINRSPYMPFPMRPHQNEYQVPDYDDAYMSNVHDDYEYNLYEKYPLMQYYNYYPNKNYFRDKAARRSLDSYEYFDDQIPRDDLPSVMSRQEVEEAYPYGQDWFDDEIPRYDRNADANAAFLQNLIMAQMYQDARNQYPYNMDSFSDDYDDQHWSYGVPTTEVEDKEKVKQYFKNKEDEEVRELESLTRKKDKNKKIKGKDVNAKQKSADNSGKYNKSKMTDNQYFDMQKQLVVNSRKNNMGSMMESFRVDKKQGYDSSEINNNFWSLYRPNDLLKQQPDPVVASLKSLTLDKGVKNIRDTNENKNVAPSSTTIVVPSTLAPKVLPSMGQKEVVLPRPSNPARSPFGEVSSRSEHQPSVYNSIKKLLNMEKDLETVSSFIYLFTFINNDKLLFINLFCHFFCIPKN